MKNRKKISVKQLVFRLILLGLLLFLAFNRQMVVYLYEQAQVQLHIICNTKDIDEVLNSPEYSEKIKSKLILIQKISRYAIDSIGLHDSENYQTFYDQKGKQLIWLVKACPPFELKPYLWSFPLVGTFPYKGFFNKERAEKTEQELLNKNYDTRIGKVGGWSTLGFLKDPVLSKMLNRSEGDLAELIIHELTHATIFIKDSMKYNENLATFVGEKGAELYLKDKYGKESTQFLEYVYSNEDYDRFANHVIAGTQKLDSLYKSFSTKLDLNTKKQIKQKYIRQIQQSLDTAQMHSPERFAYFTDTASYHPNNAYFIGYLIYRDDLSDFEKEFQNEGKANLKTYIEYLKQK